MPRQRSLDRRRRPSADLPRVGALLLLGSVLFGLSPHPVSAQDSLFGIQPGDEIEIRIFTQSGEPLEAV